MMSMKSRSRIIEEWKQLDFQRESTLAIQQLAEMLKAKTRGIINYFGQMETRSLEKLFRHLDYRIAKWVKKKFKRLNSYLTANIGCETLSRTIPTCLNIGR